VVLAARQFKENKDKKVAAKPVAARMKSAK
jgi:hypothetical protein